MLKKSAELRVLRIQHRWLHRRTKNIERLKGQPSVDDGVVTKEIESAAEHQQKLVEMTDQIMEEWLAGSRNRFEFQPFPNASPSPIFKITEGSSSLPRRNVVTIPIRRNLDKNDVADFLTHLAADKNLAADTQRVALSFALQENDVVDLKHHFKNRRG